MALASVRPCGATNAGATPCVKGASQRAAPALRGTRDARALLARPPRARTSTSSTARPLRIAAEAQAPPSPHAYAPANFEVSLQTLKGKRKAVYQVGTRYLDVGSHGDDVRELQRFLRDQGYFPKEQDLTGYFGPLTESCVIAWQKDHGVPTTGGFGVHSRTVLLAVLEGRGQRRSVTYTEVAATGPAPVSVPGWATAWPLKVLAVAGLFTGGWYISQLYFRRLREEEALQAAMAADRDEQVIRYRSMLSRDRSSRRIATDGVETRKATDSPTKPADPETKDTPSKGKGEGNGEPEWWKSRDDGEEDEEE